MESKGANVRRADSLPAPRAIDCENAARCTMKGVRRVAKARMADILDVVWIDMVEFGCKGEEVEELPIQRCH